MGSVTLPAHMDYELRLIGVVPSKAPPKEPPPSMDGVWYRDGDIPH